MEFPYVTRKNSERIFVSAQELWSSMQASKQAKAGKQTNKYTIVCRLVFECISFAKVTKTSLFLVDYNSNL